MIYYTDGSAHPNPGPGGYGIVGVENNKVKFAISRQFEGPITNNQMELKAILYVMLKELYKENNDWSQPPIVYSDSAYCVNALNLWIFNWAKAGWVKSDNKIPENIELFKAYYTLWEMGYRIDLRKIKGHDNHKYNEFADGLATGKIKAKDLLNQEN